MDRYQRALSIFDVVGDPTLDVTPIQHNMPPRDNLMPGMLTPVVSASVATVMFLCPDFLLKGSVHPSLGSANESRRVDVVLNDLSPEPPPPPPSRTGWAQPGGGNGGIDPSFVTRVVSNIPVTVAPPVDLQQIRFPDRVAYAGDPSLPVVPGGDGLRKGHGEGILGSGEASRHGVSGSTEKENVAYRYDFQMVPIKMVPVTYTYAPAELNSLLVAPIVVMATVGADGKVISARVVSGPKQLYPMAIKAALQCTFEPLAQHGLKAPIEAQIVFHPHLAASSR